MKIFSCALSILFFYIHHPVGFSQSFGVVENMKSTYGIFGQFNLNQHSADFHALPGIPNSSPNFENGSGTGTSFGLFYSFFIHHDISLSLRASYSNYSAILSEHEPTLVSINAVPTPGLFDHTIDAKLSSIGIEPFVQYYMMNNFSIFAGPRIAFVTTKTYAQKEILIEPPNEGVFVDTGWRERNISSGDLPNALNIQTAIIGGVSYDLPLNANRTVVAAPEASYAYGLLPVVSGLRWRADQIRFGIAIKFYPAIEEVPPQLPSSPIPEKKIPLLAAEVNAYELNLDGTQKENPSIRIEEFISTQMTPLLNYIFFDQNSSRIPDRYHVLTSDQIQHFKITNQSERAISLYYDLLNIIGSRMKQYPYSRITIIGCNADANEEKGNLVLSGQRSNAIFSYLRDVWTIPEKRMVMQTRNLPDKPTKPSELDGMEENRRVEIYSDTWEILHPVTITDTMRIITPSQIRFIPNVKSETGIRSWLLQVSWQHQGVRLFEADGSIPANIDWNLDSHSLSKNMTTLDYALQVMDSSQQTLSTVNKSIAFNHITILKKRNERIADKEIDHYNLILFDFDKNNLTEFNKKISEVIRARINPDARVTVTGYTDRIGDADYNQRLSKERAIATADALKLKNAIVSGRGKENPLFDNNLPEGRCYNRTVDIVVETPIEK